MKVYLRCGKSAGFFFVTLALRYGCNIIARRPWCTQASIKNIPGENFTRAIIQRAGNSAHRTAVLHGAVHAAAPYILLCVVFRFLGSIPLSSGSQESFSHPKAVRKLRIVFTLCYTQSSSRYKVHCMRRAKWLETTRRA